MQGVDAGGLQKHGDLLALRDGETLRPGADLDGVHAHLDREVGADALFDALHDLDDDPHAVLHALRAVAVVALVPES